MEKIKVSWGIFAYNEEGIIGKLLDSCLAQKLSQVQIEEIIVVSSACRDKTDEIVKEYSQKSNGLIRLIQQKERAGKSAAINIFLTEAKSDICIVQSADTICFPDTVEHLCSVFADPTVGMAGVHSIPANDPKTMMGFITQTIWQLHHEVCLVRPKCGEMVAFRKVFDQIPAESAVDEATIEAEITRAKLKIVYAPEAKIFNKGAETIRDFLKQRRRMHAGHRWLIDNFHYHVSTSNLSLLFKLILKKISRSPRRNFWLMMMIGLEIWSKILGFYDYKIKKKNPFIWDIAWSTKQMDKE